MARKSRKNTECLIGTNQKEIQKIRVAGYARNSIDKGEERNTLSSC